jgi:hypothetical protein
MGDVEIRMMVNEKGSSPVFHGNGGRFRRLTRRFPCEAGPFRIKQTQYAPSFGVKRLTKAAITGPARIAGGVI